MSFFLAAALDGAGRFTSAEWAAPARHADALELDFVTIEDAFGPPADGPARLEAPLVAAHLAPLTRHVGLVPVATTTHTEPFHLSTALATVDHVSGGRGGWQVRVSADPAEAALLGRRAPLPIEELFAEAADAVEVVRRLWDSWQDDAIIRDVATGRYVDRDRLHYIDFTGPYFAVKGPSIVPRPPQGQPVVAALAHSPAVYEFAARTADVVFTTPDDDSLDRIVGEVRAASATIRLFADLAFGPTPDHARVLIGDPAEAAGLMADWHARGVDGFRLRSTGDLSAIVGELRARGLFEPHTGTLRERLGLPPAINRYEEARVA